MSAGKAIYDILSNDAGVTAITSRIYAERAPQNVSLPYVVYSVVSSVPTDGKNSYAKIIDYRVQIDIYDGSYSEVNALRNAVVTALNYTRGTYNSVVVDDIKYETEQDGLVESQDEYRKIIDFTARIK